MEAPGGPAGDKHMTLKINDEYSLKLATNKLWNLARQFSAASDAELLMAVEAAKDPTLRKRRRQHGAYVALATAADELQRFRVDYIHALQQYFEPGEPEQPPADRKLPPRNWSKALDLSRNKVFLDQLGIDAGKFLSHARVEAKGGQRWARYAPGDIPKVNSNLRVDRSMCEECCGQPTLHLGDVRQARVEA